jgi:hypothetical protein
MLTRSLNRLLQSVIITSAIYLTMSVSQTSIRQPVNSLSQIEPPHQEMVSSSIK